MQSGARTRLVTYLCAASAGLGVPACAGAQLVPGTREPANIAEAIDDTRMLVCTLAAAGRPMGGEEQGGVRVAPGVAGFVAAIGRGVGR